MSDFTAVRAVSMTLQEMLRQNITLSPEPELTTVQIHLQSPKDMTQLGLRGVSLWLYRVTRNADRLTEPRRRVAVGQLVPLPLPVHLHYLITPMSGDDVGDHALLGRVLQVFHDRAILRGGVLQDSLANSDAELRVLMEMLTTEELARIWNALQEPYQPSLTYEVQLVEIDAMREPERASPVIVKETVYTQIVS